MGDAIQELLVTDVGLEKLGARAISAQQAAQVPRTAGHRPRPTRRSDSAATLRILVSIEGEDADRLERIASAQGKKLGDVLADLLGAADRPA